MGITGMKAVILAGGLGSRLSEETNRLPKPMVEIGGRPILWHIMKIYSHYGVRDFIVCLGYMGFAIKEFFFNYALRESDVTIDIQKRETTFHRCNADPWRITLVETGLASMTGGRLRRIREHLGDNDFFMTYGDGLADVDLVALMQHHTRHRCLATVTAIAPRARFGSLMIEDGVVHRFKEKPEYVADLINGGFFVLSPKVIDYIPDDMMPFEHEPLERLTADRQLAAYHHTGFWQAMDTLREKHMLEEMWASGRAPWKIWESAV